MWDPGFGIWQAFDVRINSSMLLLAGDFSTATETFVGFNEDREEAVLAALSTFPPLN